MKRIGDRAMTAAERQGRYRLALNADVNRKIVINERRKAYNASYWIKIRARRVWFKDHYVLLRDIVRAGKCSMCGAVGRTHLHHDQYDPTDVLAYTRELCTGCHNKERA